MTCRSQASAGERGLLGSSSRGVGQATRWAGLLGQAGGVVRLSKPVAWWAAGPQRRADWEQAGGWSWAWLGCSKSKASPLSFPP
jgi:hypothetical protein